MKKRKLKISGTEKKVAFVWDMLASGDDLTWKSSSGVIIQFRKTNTLKVQREIYEMLQRRKDLGVF